MSRPFLTIPFLVAALVLASGIALARAQGGGREAAPLDPFARPSLVYTIPVTGKVMIDLPVAAFIKRGIRQARERRADHVVIELDTPGGDAEVMFDIMDAVDRAAEDMNIVAWVTGDAWSAGAYICMACDKVYMKKGASIGAAMPVLVSPFGGASPVERKQLSAFTGRFQAFAEKRGRPRNLAGSMVDPQWVTILCRVDGKVQFLTPDEIAALEREGKDLKRGETIGAKDTPLTLTATKAAEYGFIDGVANDLPELWAQLGVRSPATETLQRSASERWALLVYNWRLLFLALGILGLVLEFKLPGLGFPGILGLACLAVFFGSAWMVGSASAIEISLFLLGLVLLALEIFVLPGFGVAGFAGIILVFFSLVLSLHSFSWPGNPLEWRQLQGSLTSMAVVLLGCVAAMFLLSRWLPQVPGFRWMVLAGPSPRAVRGSAAASSAMQDGPPIGARGRTSTPLRPAGTALFDGVPVDVLTAGDFIEPGAEVQVLERSDNRVVVERAPVQPEAPANPGRSGTPGAPA